MHLKNGRPAFHGWVIGLLGKGAIVLAALSGCTPVTSQNPLSDEETSVVDKELFGHWRLVERENKVDPDQPRFVVGRAKGATNTLELVFADLRDEAVKVYRLPLLATSVDGTNYLSVQVPNEDSDDFLIFQYRLIEHDPRRREDDELRLFPLATEVVVRAIEGKKLPGTVQRYEKPVKRSAMNPFKWEYQSVRITASADQLVAYISKNEQRLFDAEHPIVLKRSRPILQ